VIINPYKYPISIYAIFLTSSILIGFFIATMMLVRNKTNKIAICCSLILNGVMLIYFGLVFNYLVNIGKDNTSLGFTSMGGVIGVTLGSVIMYLIFKDLMLLQAYLTVFPLIYSISKIGCFFGGCCGGREYYGPLSVNYIDKDGALVHPYLTFPVPLLESAVFLLIFVAIVILFRKLSFRIHIALNSALCCIAKFGIDFLRSSHEGVVISINQLLCAIVFVMTLIFLILGKRFFSTSNQASDRPTVDDK